MTEGSPDNTAIWIQTIWRKPKEDLTSTESRGGSWSQNICSKQKKGVEEQENKCLITLNYKSWDCLVIIVIRLRPRRQKNRGSIPGGGKRYVSSQQPQTDSGAHPVYYSIGSGRSFLGGGGEVAGE
jgi:hypothetical protein